MTFKSICNIFLVCFVIFLVSCSSARLVKNRSGQWIRELDTAIANKFKGAETANTTSSSSRSFSTNKSSNCDNQGYEPAYGYGRIKNKSSVNIRSGASTSCSIIGSMNQRNVFSLIGRQQNWYYISLDNGKTAWIYAPLVGIVSDDPIITEASGSTPVPPPPPPIPVAKNISIAVIDFKTLNEKSQEISLGSLISEGFTTALVNSRTFKIIERDQLDKVVKEIEMNQTGFIETTDAVQVGKMLHADAIITGSVALLNNQIQLNARIIEVESAYVISAETRITAYSLKNITRITNEIVMKLSEKMRRK